MKTKEDGDEPIHGDARRFKHGFSPSSFFYNHCSPWNSWLGASLSPAQICPICSSWQLACDSHSPAGWRVTEATLRSTDSLSRAENFKRASQVSEASRPLSMPNQGGKRTIEVPNMFSGSRHRWLELLFPSPEETLRNSEPNLARCIEQEKRG